jgi:hypothetical protein
MSCDGQIYRTAEEIQAAIEDIDAAEIDAVILQLQ